MILLPRIKREDLAILREYENNYIRVSNMILGESCTKAKRLHHDVPEPQNSPCYCNLLYRCEDEELFVDSGHHAWFEPTYNRGCKNQHPAVCSYMNISSWLRQRRARPSARFALKTLSMNGLILELR